MPSGPNGALPGEEHEYRPRLTGASTDVRQYARTTLPVGWFAISIYAASWSRKSSQSAPITTARRAEHGPGAFSS